MPTDDFDNPAPTDDLTPDEILPDEIQTAVMQIRSEPLPRAALERALDRARQLNAVACTVPRLSFRRQLWQRAAIATGVAACVLAVALLWPTRATVAWAQVAAAVQGRPWIHVQEKYADVATAEGWVSTTHGISASRRGERVDFHDGKLRISTQYNPQEGV